VASGSSALLKLSLVMGLDAWNYTLPHESYSLRYKNKLEFTINKWC
jgi:hypothetical protein